MKDRVDAGTTAPALHNTGSQAGNYQGYSKRRTPVPHNTGIYSLPALEYRPCICPAQDVYKS